MTRPRFGTHMALTTASLGGDSQDLPAPLSRFQHPGVAPGFIAARCDDGSPAARWKHHRAHAAAALRQSPTMSEEAVQTAESETGGRGPRSSAARVSSGQLSARMRGWSYVD